MGGDWGRVIFLRSVPLTLSSVLPIQGEELCGRRTSRWSLTCPATPTSESPTSMGGVWGRVTF
ncbi:MAG: hypothetical protein WCD51_12845, partial [Anaerolineae bacterium]